jgi:hypothetical protein
MYLALPLMFSQQISGNKLKSVIIHFTYGLSVSALLKHDIKADLHGFSTRGGVKTHYLKNKSEQVSFVNANIHSGLRIENQLYGKETFIFVQPEFLFPVLSANSSSERHHLFAAGIQVGIYYVPDKDKKKL